GRDVIKIPIAITVRWHVAHKLVVATEKRRIARRFKTNRITRAIMLIACTAKQRQEGATRHRLHRTPVKLRDRRHTSEIKNGGRNIGDEAELRYMPPRRNAVARNNEGNAKPAFPRIELEEGTG